MAQEKNTQRCDKQQLNIDTRRNIYYEMEC